MHVHVTVATGLSCNWHNDYIKHNRNNIIIIATSIFMIKTSNLYFSDNIIYC